MQYGSTNYSEYYQWHRLEEKIVWREAKMT